MDKLETEIIRRRTNNYVLFQHLTPFIHKQQISLDELCEMLRDLAEALEESNGRRKNSDH